MQISRLKIFLLVNTLVFLMWGSILFIIQILHPYQEFAIEIRTRTKKHKAVLYPWRGNIYDKFGRLLTTSDKLYQLDLQKNVMERYFKNQQKRLKKLIQKYGENKIPKKILKKYPYRSIKEVKAQVLKILAKYSGVSRKRLKSLINSKYGIVSISDKISEKNLYYIRKEFKEKKLKGLYYKLNMPVRIYPNGRLAVRLLGATVLNTNKRIFKNNDTKNEKAVKYLVGITGIEATFDKYLKGKLGYREEFKNALRQNVYYNNLKSVLPINGNSIYLNIDADLQKIVENEIKNGIKEYEAKMGMAVIMNPTNGEILAMAGITKNDYKYKPERLALLSNLPASYTFEPGSTIKPFTALLAIEKHLVKENEKIDCRTFNSGGRIIKDVHKYNKLTLREIIAHSSNVGISKIAEKVGKEDLYELLFDVGFGHPTGSDLYNEAGGTFREVSKWSTYSLQSISFGQEMSVTALQLASAYCAIANNGKVLKPLIADKITDENGKIIKKYKKRVITTISDKKSLSTLRSYLQSVVDFGTATALKNDLVSVAGKTGTAEKKGKNGYSKDKYTSVFAGFFPVDNPKYVMVVVYDEANYQKKYYYAAQSAVPTFKRIMLQIIDKYDSKLIVENKKREGKFVEMPDLIGKSEYQAKGLLRSMGLKYKITKLNDENMVSSQYPEAGMLVDKEQEVKLIVGLQKEENQNFVFGKMPNLKGKTLVEAIKIAKKLKIKLKIKGKGIIEKQYPSPGQKIKIGQICEIIAE